MPRNLPCCPYCGKNHVIRHGFSKLKRSRRRRYRCRLCGRSFCTTTGSVYHRLQCSHNKFDLACALSVEGANKSAIARLLKVTWNTVARWLSRAAAAAKHFNDKKLKDFHVQEVQADEIRTFVGSKSRPTWIIVAIAVGSRLWPSLVLGRRTYRNIRALFTDLFKRAQMSEIPLITTDGYNRYTLALKHLLKGACLYGQVVKTRRKDRVVAVDRKVLIGTDRAMATALENSEDSEKLNTSFIERLNLTIRRCSAYLHRRSPAHAREGEHLKAHLDLLQCYYNFVRPHGALKFGRETSTPAMQAGLAKKPLTFRQIFMAVLFWAWICSSFRSHLRPVSNNG